MNGSKNISIDLNCDLGEGLSNDALLMPFISSANIACGFHAGNEDVMKRTVELCLLHDVAIGAHPGFHDKENFGRKELQLTDHEYRELILEQLELLDNICLQFDTKMHHVKPHGALYNMSARDAHLADIIAEAVKEFNDELIVYGLSGSFSGSEAKKLGLQTADEVFADRRYEDNGSLTPRSHEHALIENEEESLQQVLHMILHGQVISRTGKNISIKAETICIHGDGKHAVAFAQNIHSTLLHHGINIRTI